MHHPLTPTPHLLTYINCYLTLLRCPLTLFHSPLMRPSTFKASGHTLMSVFLPLTPARCPLTCPYRPLTPRPLTPCHCRLTLFSRPLAPLVRLLAPCPANASPLSFNTSLSHFTASPSTCNAFLSPHHFTLSLFNQ